MSGLGTPKDRDERFEAFAADARSASERTGGRRSPFFSSDGLPTVLDVPQAARLLGIGRTLAYELVRTSQWPTPVIRMGRLIKIPSGPIVELMNTGGTSGQRPVG